jgi:uncharacterized protein YbaR (Trm112 family)
MIAAELLNLLCCPENHQPLAVADAALVESLNGRIATGEIRNRAGHPVTERIDGGLIRDDRKYLYPIRGTVPVLLIDEAIPLS